tara:strand:- start:6827 stop:6994 length:168 start_codon:yes stop_codon:yes gene_type:complete
MWYDNGGCWLTFIQYANEKKKYKTFIYDWIVNYKIDYVVIFINILVVFNKIKKYI